MKQKGFYISKIKIEGEGKTPVIIPFKKGLNVVTGPSESGKSFLYKSIYFILGGQEAPDFERTVPESIGYNTFFLELIKNNGKIITLRRKRHNSSPIDFCEIPIDEISETTEFKEVKYTDISKFLLRQIDLPEKKVLKTKEKVANLTFGDLKNLFFVDENSITDGTKSPILSGQYVTQTRERSVFKYFLSNEDDSNLNINNKSESLIANYKGKKETFLAIIKNLTSEISETEKNPELKNFKDIELRLKNLYEQQNKVNQYVQNYNKKIDELNKQKNGVNNDLIKNRGIFNRFKLLKEYYLNDLKRLDLLKENNEKTKTLKDVNCPLCGAESKKEEIHDYSQVLKAITSERVKIQTNISSLEKSIKDTLDEINICESSLKNLNIDFTKLSEEYKKNVEPDVKINQEELKKYIEIKSILVQKEKNEKKLENYKAELAKIAQQIEELTPAKFEIKEILLNKKTLLVNIEKEIQNLINDWNVKISTENGAETCSNIEFDFDKCDIKINGRPRSSFGKGVRAILYTAFMVGFMKYCMNNEELYHPGTIVIDSPLTTYKPNKGTSKNEDLSKDTHQLFYASLSSYISSQIIILENNDKTPDKNLNVNLIDLQKTNGLFPKNI